MRKATGAATHEGFFSGTRPLPFRSLYFNLASTRYCKKEEGASRSPAVVLVRMFSCGSVARLESGESALACLYLGLSFHLRGRFHPPPQDAVVREAWASMTDCEG